MEGEVGKTRTETRGRKGGSKPRKESKGRGIGARASATKRGKREREKASGLKILAKAPLGRRVANELLRLLCAAAAAPGKRR